MASRETDQAANDALARLADDYRDAVMQWFLRAGLGPDVAEDLTHDFLVDLLSGKVLAGFERRDARFRTFLQSCLRNFLRDHHRRVRAAKRGGGDAALPLEEAIHIAADALPDSVLDRAVAAIAHERAFRQVRDEWARAGRADRFEAFQSRLLGDETSGQYGPVAGGLGISVGLARKIVFELRESYYLALRREVAQTVAPADLEGEMRHLVAALAAAQESLTP